MILANNNKTKLWMAANGMFVIHMIWMTVVIFGWAIPGIYPFYVAFLVVNLILEIYFGYCIFTKWEFDLRKQVNPNFEYGPSFIRHYLNKFFGYQVSHSYIKPVAIGFLVVSILANFVYIWLRYL